MTHNTLLSYTQHLTGNYFNNITVTPTPFHAVLVEVRLSSSHLEPTDLHHTTQPKLFSRLYTSLAAEYFAQAPSRPP